MKIATLTLHLPFNYGNALQQFSLHKYLLEQGYEAEILSHWFCKDRDEIRYYSNRIGRNWKNLVRFIWACCQWTGAFSKYRQERKLGKWLDQCRWSTVTGANSIFPTEKLDQDIVIAGSDQIWNPIYRTSDFFLLPDFPDRIKKIAYAASFGTDSFIEERKPFYAANLSRFAAISVRESSAKEIIERDLGSEATLVADPTLLHTREEWCELLGIEKNPKVSRDLAMYLVTPSHRDFWRDWMRLAKESGRRLHVFVFSWAPVPSVDIRHPLSSIKFGLKNLAKRALLYLSGVRLHFSATPSEFVGMISRCDGLITDSFHGMMFATIFGKKCNVTIGEHAERQQMSARLRNFTADFGRPEILTPKADISAMRELSVTPKLQELIDISKDWLRNAIESSTVVD